ncbi:MAG: PrgI family protein [bacterium]|nr:PrgI family protein [bacterium]
MQFQVPQFIDIEDKIFGPLTFKQFIYVLGAGGSAFIVYKLIPNFYLALLVASPIVILALLLAFYKFNDRSFILMLESMFKYYSSSRIFLWKKTLRPGSGQAPKIEENVIGLPAFNPRMTAGKLKDIAWTLDVHETIKK